MLECDKERRKSGGSKNIVLRVEVKKWKRILNAYIPT